ncbi:TnsA-like heteromeric transposase endonuclease subunit [Streptomyces sp. NPDC093221]|uniref:TnsA-like heteromeric transposase endonuclease subunit n=1 Tax=Streptomyces sp. NPDC093221 TaxID=3366032 RepID=UPI0038012813
MVEDLEWPSVPLGLLREARPWRMFRWYKGQQHYSGTYWSATVGDHVIYESRLELGRLLFADFAPEMRHIIAQPFMLKADVDGKVRKHIPDYLLVTDDGPVVVDVKPRHRLEKPEIAFSARLAPLVFRLAATPRSSLAQKRREWPRDHISLRQLPTASNERVGSRRASQGPRAASEPRGGPTPDGPRKLQGQLRCQPLDPSPGRRSGDCGSYRSAASRWLLRTRRPGRT